jgi:hypothetical protein
MKEKGAALITVIMVLLILTVLGLAMSLLMTQEDRASGRQDAQKLALYAAEAGLRRGEQILRGTAFVNVSNLLQHQSTALQAWQETPTTPIHPVFNAGKADLTTWDSAHLGTYLVDGSAELANVQLPLPGERGLPAFYSIYVRNNPTDPSGSATANSDGQVRLISVGWVASSADPNASWAARAVRAVKILEEEYSWSGFAQGQQTQKLGTPGGTGSGVYEGGSSLPPTGGP